MTHRIWSTLTAPQTHIPLNTTVLSKVRNSKIFGADLAILKNNFLND